MWNYIWLYLKLFNRYYDKSLSGSNWILFYLEMVDTINCKIFFFLWVRLEYRTKKRVFHMTRLWWNIQISIFLVYSSSEKTICNFLKKHIVDNTKLRVSIISIFYWREHEELVSIFEGFFHLDDIEDFLCWFITYWNETIFDGNNEEFLVNRAHGDPVQYLLFSLGCWSYN